MVRYFAHMRKVLDKEDMQNYFRQAEYVLSAAELHQLPKDVGYEVVFAGCSNVGKSSTLNLLTDNAKLARTSKTPGRTQCLNIFRMDDDRRLIDLPGYGYAAVPARIKVKWQQAIDAYLRERKCLRGIVLVIDIRTPLKLFEKQMIEWAVNSDMPIHLVLNKADKLSKSAAKSTLLKVEKALEAYAGAFSIQMMSTKEKQGLGELLGVLNKWYKL